MMITYSPWKNSAVLSNDRPFWTRLSFVNTGEVPDQDVIIAMKFGLDFSWRLDAADGRSAHVYTDSVVPTNLSFQDLVHGIDIGTVEVGEEVEILVPIAVSGDWKKKLCDNGQAMIQVAINVQNFIEYERQLNLYPDNSLCKN